MNANLELERRLADFYASEALQRAPDRVLESVLATSENTTQRRLRTQMPQRSPNVNTFAKFATAAAAVTVVGAIGIAILAPGRTPHLGSVQALPEIVVTEANVPSGLTVHRTVRGIEALRTSRVVPADVVGFVDAMETSFDGDEDHQGDHEDLYTTFGAVFESVTDAERAFDAAVVLHEAGDGWGLAAGEAPIKRDPVPGLGDASVHYTQGSDYGYPEISVYLWRVDNVLLHAVDYHPYDRSDLLESIVRAMDARAEESLEDVGS